MKKQNLPLIVGVSIPILMIALLAVSIYLPRLFIVPRFDLLYVSTDDNNRGSRYLVEGGGLIKTKNKIPGRYKRYLPPGGSSLYVYNVDTNKVTEVSFEEAQKLNLDPSIESPDGFEVVCGNRDNGVFLFFLGANQDCSDRYLSGHNVSKKLNLKLNSSSAYDNFRFLGWVEKDGK